MGCYPTGTDDLVETVAANLRSAGFLVKVTPDVMPYKWGKLMNNLTNATLAITNVRGGDTQPILAAVQQEATDILAQAGIRWVSNEELSQEWPERNVKPRGVVPDDSGSSTWQSLTRRQGTVETDFLNGEIVRLADQLKSRAPLNEKLLHICQEMASKGETPGKYTPTELSRLLGLD
jgi:2-dehydropantoate 2-reductase